MKPGKQLHLSGDHTKPLAAPVRAVENSEESAFCKKPKRETGFWTSSWQEETQDSGWVEWCVSENFDEPYKRAWWVLTPAKTANLYIVDGLADLLTLLDQFPWETEMQQRMNAILEASWKEMTLDPLMLRVMGPTLTTRRNRHRCYIDFERLAQEYDGIWLTEQGNCETHLSYPHDLSGWDCESILWFRWCFDHVERIETPSPERDGVA